MRRVIDLRGEPAAGGVAAELMGALPDGAALGGEHAASPGSDAAGTDQHHRDVILRVAAQIRESVRGRVPPVAALAKQAGYSVDHFSRIFQKITGALARRITSSAPRPSAPASCCPSRTSRLA